MGRPVTRRLPPSATLPGARIHISHKVFGRTGKLGFMVVAQTATTTSRADPNPRQDKGHQENYAECDERSTHVDTSTEGQPSFIESPRWY
jgi:hypothetical protein